MDNIMKNYVLNSSIKSNNITTYSEQEQNKALSAFTEEEKQTIMKVINNDKERLLLIGKLITLDITYLHYILLNEIKSYFYFKNKSIYIYYLYTKNKTQHIFSFIVPLLLN